MAPGAAANFNSSQGLRCHLMPCEIDLSADTDAAKDKRVVELPSTEYNIDQVILNNGINKYREIAVRTAQLKFFCELCVEFIGLSCISMISYCCCSGVDCWLLFVYLRVC